MSFQINIPPSMVAKMTKNEETIDESSEKKKKEDWRKIKELEEARKAGTAPAMQDEEGKDINPHIPQYIMQAPWYTGAIRPTLQHQREPDEMKKEYSAMNEWYKKGVNTGKIATKFREGACDNCGALGHKKKDCLERPRTKGARYTGNFAPDDFEQPTLRLSYDGKRDRWNGFDSSEYKEIVEHFQKVEEVKREIKAKKLENSLLDGEPNEEEIDDEDDEKYADNIAMPGQKFETKQRITVRNLRIREDTAKYLFNLDVNSAFYDPKTRAMRMNPFEGSNIDPRERPYAGDNFVRYSGDAMETIKKQKFAWEAYSKGTDVHVQADPTKLELFHKEYLKKKEAYKESLKESIIEKYQGQEYLEVPPKELLLGQNEEYVEYTRHGTLAKGNKKAVVRSRYEEDVLENNHKAIWGSYWEAGKWGYKCCQSLIRGAYCIGEAGLRLKMLGEQMTLDDEEINMQVKDRKQDEDSQTTRITSSIEPTSLFHQHLEKHMAEERKKKKGEKKKRKRSHSKKKHSRRDSSDDSSGDDDDDSYSSSDDDDNKRKVKRARSSEKHKKEKSKHKKNKKSKKIKKRRSTTSNDSQSSDDDALKKAIEKQKKKVKEFDDMVSKNERDLPFNVTYDIKKPTEKEEEAYQRLRMRPEDPMANYFKK